MLSPKSVFRASPKNIDSSFDNEEDVDVEQWSDSEDSKSIKTEADSSTKNKDANSPSNDTPSDPPPKKKKKDEKPKFLKPKCNSEELLHVDCYLETKELWDKFNELGTEMIITKTGR